jgi:hypothetical protein
MKVIILDHDGVICLDENWGSSAKRKFKYFKKNPEASKLFADLPIEVRFDGFDKKSVKVLNRILEATGAEIVVSSDWRKEATLEEMGDYYISQGISKRPIAFTPRLALFDPTTASLFEWKWWYDRIRIIEINEWLKNNEVEAWVSVDDLNMSKAAHSENGLDFFVLMERPYNEGIKQTGKEQEIINILNKTS